jgi:hypothetical protein
VTRTTLITWLILLSAGFSACSSSAQKNKPKPAPVQALQAGQYYDAVAAKNDPASSYALYLPTTWSATARMPVILLFDPHADGTLPVKKYRDLAEKYKLILVGSNNSKNGQQPQETENILYTLFEEIHDRIGVNPDMIYTAGFSGGSRVAAMTAMYRGQVRGVIACGAGLPQGGAMMRFTFDYFGIAGNADFNMWEMNDQRVQLTKAGITNEQIFFRGIHEWPPAPVIDLGIRWHIERAMEKGIFPKAEDFAKNSSAEKERLLKDGTIVELKKSDEQVHKKEIEAQSMYQQAIGTKDLDWWDKQVKKLNIRKGIPPSDTLMNYRLTSFLSLMCWSYCNHSLQAKDANALDYCVKLYELVDPKNPEIPHLKSELSKLHP